MKNNGNAGRALTYQRKVAALTEEIEFLTRCGVGEAAILSALGYTRNPLTLKKRLERAGRRDLIPRIFEWQAEIEAQQHPRRAA